MARARTTTLLTVVVALTALGLGGCGEEETTPTAAPSDTASVSVTPSPSSTKSATVEPPPPCNDVWGGKQLPRRYQGCRRGGELVKARKLFCSSGQVIVTFEGRYYAVPGGPVNDVGSLDDSEQFQQASRSCGA